MSSTSNILVVVNKDKPWKTFKDMLAEVQANDKVVEVYLGR